MSTIQPRAIWLTTPTQFSTDFRTQHNSKERPQVSSFYRLRNMQPSQTADWTNNRYGQVQVTRDKHNTNATQHRLPDTTRLWGAATGILYHAIFFWYRQRNSQDLWQIRSARNNGEMQHKHNSALTLEHIAIPRSGHRPPYSWYPLISTKEHAAKPERLLEQRTNTNKC